MIEIPLVPRHASLHRGHDEGPELVSAARASAGRRIGAPTIRRSTSPVLVTGGSGYLGTQLIVGLLQAQMPVRAPVGSAVHARELGAAVRRAGVEHTDLEIAVADLTSDEGCAAAVVGCETIHHIAVPTIAGRRHAPDGKSRPAHANELRVLRAACDAGARRVVLTSSPASVDMTVLERAAWNLIDRDGVDTELVIVNPTSMLGPTLIPRLKPSVEIVKAMLAGRMSVVPRRWLDIIDNRDVADLHIRAMLIPRAAGKRYLAVTGEPAVSLLQVAEILRHRLGSLGRRTPTQAAPGEDEPRPTIHDDRARSELGWRPRPAETTIVHTAQSLLLLDEGDLH